MDRNELRAKLEKEYLMETLISDFARLEDEIAALKAEIERLKYMLAPKVLYGIRKGKIEELTSVYLEYHFDGEEKANFDGDKYQEAMWADYPKDFGKRVFFTREEAEARLGEGKE